MHKPPIGVVPAHVYQTASVAAAAKIPYVYIGGIVDHVPTEAQIKRANMIRNCTAADVKMIDALPNDESLELSVMKCCRAGDLQTLQGTTEPKEITSDQLLGPLKYRPLHFACRYNSLPIIKYLLPLGVDTTAQSMTGKTPLHFAVNYFHLPAVELMCAQSNATQMKLIKDNLGHTPYQSLIHAIGDDGDHLANAMREKIKKIARLIQPAATTVDPFAAYPDS